MSNVSNRETPAFVCSHVFSKVRPVLLVSREDGDWQLLCGMEHDISDKARVIGLSHLFVNDPTLVEISDLPINWEAERTAVGGVWTKRKIS